jgi:hypothetical protein
MTKLAQRGQSAAASLLVPSLALLALAVALLAAAAFPSVGLAAEEGGEAPVLVFSPAPLDFGKATVGTESTTVTVDVYNEGGATGNVTGVSAEGGDSADFKVSGSNCGQLDPGQHCSAWVLFAPGSTGAKQSTLVAALKEAPSQTTPLAGTGVAPQLAFTPGSHDFGIQRTNESQSANFQLTNSGEAFLYLGSIGIAGPDAGNFWTNNSDCWNGRRLDPGESCSLQVNFNAWDAVEYHAQVQAYVNGSTFSADLAGTGGRVMLEPDTNPVDFAAATAGGEGELRTIVLTNNGNIAGAFFIAVVAGGDSGSFRLLDESCTGEPLTPGATCVAHVRFTPQSVGPKLARLALFGDGDGGTMVMLSGTGVAPAATLAPSGFDFGNAEVGSRSEAHSFAVRNEGSAPLSLGAVAIVGADPDQFIVAGDECSESSLAPGSECLVRVRFAPDSAEAKAAKLRIGSSAGSFIAALTGTGTDPVDDPRWLDEAGAGGSAGPVAEDAWRSGHRRARHRRFSRGDAVASARGRAARRADIRRRTIPR